MVQQLGPASRLSQQSTEFVLPKLEGILENFAKVDHLLHTTALYNDGFNVRINITLWYFTKQLLL